VPLDVGDPIGLSPLHDSWELPKAYTTEEVLSSKTLWIYQMMTARGGVRASGKSRGKALDPSTVTLSALTVGLEGHGVPGQDSPNPWNPLWMRRHRIEESRIVQPIGEDGVFSARVPRIRGIAIRATAPGWKPAFALLSTNEGPGPVAVELVLHPASVLEGVLKSSNGSPMSNVRVVAYVSERSGFAGLNRERLKLKADGAFTASWNPRKNLARVTHINWAITDQEGRYAISLNADGDVYIVVHAEGHLPVRKSVGWTDADREGEDLLAQVTAEPPVRGEYGGNPLPKHQVTIGDLSVGDFQPAIEVETDESGAIPTDWLEDGRRYLVMVRGPGVPRDEFVAAKITWSGQEALEMRELAARYREETGVAPAPKKR